MMESQYGRLTFRRVGQAWQSRQGGGGVGGGPEETLVFSDGGAAAHEMSAVDFGELVVLQRQHGEPAGPESAHHLQ